MERGPAKVPDGPGAKPRPTSPYFAQFQRRIRERVLVHARPGVDPRQIHDAHCTICLKEIGRDRGVLQATCAHSFCYMCIVFASKVNDDCPRCSTKYTAIVREVDGVATETIQIAPHPPRAPPPAQALPHCEACARPVEAAHSLHCKACDAIYHPGCSENPPSGPALRISPPPDWLCGRCSHVDDMSDSSSLASLRLDSLPEAPSKKRKLFRVSAGGGISDSGSPMSSPRSSRNCSPWNSPRHSPQPFGHGPRVRRSGSSKGAAGAHGAAPPGAAFAFHPPPADAMALSPVIRPVPSSSSAPPYASAVQPPRPAFHGAHAFRHSPAAASSSSSSAIPIPGAAGGLAAISPSTKGYSGSPTDGMDCEGAGPAPPARSSPALFALPMRAAVGRAIASAKRHCGESPHGPSPPSAPSLLAPPPAPPAPPLLSPFPMLPETARPPGTLLLAGWAAPNPFLSLRGPGAPASVPGPGPILSDLVRPPEGPLAGPPLPL
eukprot:tig00000473_g1201.t1